MAKSGYEVLVKIIADAGKAKAEFDRAGAAAERMAKKTEDEVEKSRISMDRMGKQAAITGGVMMAAGGAMALALSRTVQSAQEAEMAQIRLQNTVKGSKALGADAINAFEGQAKSLQRITVASDEAVMGIQSVLGQFGLTKNEVLTLTPLVVDISRKMGVDFNGAAKAVAKAADGSTTALKRMGIVVDATKAKVDPFGATVDALRRAAGGFAQTEGKTFAGQMAILSNQADEVKESVGRGVLSVLNALVPVAVKGANVFNSMNESTGNLVGSTLALATGFLLVGGGALTAIGTFTKLKETYDALAASSSILRTATSVAPYVAVAAIGVMAGMKIGEAMLHGADMADKGYSKVFSADSGKLKMKAFLTAAEGETRKSVTGLGNLLRGAVALTMDAATLSHDFTDELVNSLSAKGVNKAFKQLLTLDPASAKSVLDYINTHKSLRDQLTSMGVPLSQYRKLVKDTVDTNHDGKRSIEEKVNALKDEAKAQDEYHNQMMDAGNQVRQFASAQLEVDRATRGVTDAQKAYAEAIKSGDPDKVAEAQLNLRGVMIQLANANDQVTAAAIKQAEAQLALKLLAADDKKYSAEIAHLHELRDAIDDPAMKAAIQGQIDNLTLLHITAGQELNFNDATAMESLWRLVAAGRVTEEQLKALQAKWNAGTVDTSGVTGPLDAVIAKAKEAHGILAGLNVGALTAANDVAKYFQAYNTLHTTHPDWTPDNINAYLRMHPELTRANGGPVTGGTMYLVGERGPELFVAPSGGGNIVPNHALRGGIASSVSGAATVTINVNASPLAAPADTGAAIVDALKAYERRNGRLPLTVT